MKIFLSWLPILGAIWIGSMLCERVLQGLETAYILIIGKKVENLNLERVRSLLLLAGFYAIMGGMALLALAESGRIKEENILPGLAIAQLAGILHGIFLNKTYPFVMWTKKNIIINSGSVTGMGIGIFFGAIIGIFAPGIAAIIMGILIPTTGLILLIVFHSNGKLDRINSVAAFFIFFYLFIAGGVLGMWIIDNIKDGIPCLIFGCLDGLILGGVLGCVTGLIISIKHLTFPLFLTPLTIFVTQREKICSRCLRYSNPFKSKYDFGSRTCEHCAQELGQSKQRGKVIFIFGNYHVGQKGNVLPDPDFEKKKAPIDVSEVYIDTKTADKRRLEKFITYIRNYPPKYGLDSVKIFHMGDLDDLGHLKNLILNNFTKVTAVAN